MTPVWAQRREEWWSDCLVSPDVFQQGMTVMHPEYGPGKIVALSGAGKNRRATVQFPSAGEKKIILIHSPLRPVT